MLLKPQRVSFYVYRELLGPTALGLFLYTFVLLMNHFFLVAEKSLAKSLGFDLTARLFLVGIPNLLVLAIPMSVLLGTLIGVGRLSADHEWVALQSAGQGPARLLRPALFHGLLGSLTAMILLSVVSPQTNFALRNLRGELFLAANLASDLRPRVFYTDLPNVVLFVDEIRAGTQGRLEGVLLVTSEPDGPAKELYLAESGDLYPAGNRSGALVLDLYNGAAHFFEPESPDPYRYGEFESIRKRFDPAAYLRTLLEAPLEKSVMDLSPSELWSELNEAKAARRRLVEETTAGEAERPSGRLVSANRRVSRATIELHQRIALPLASFFFAALAVPLGVTRVRSGKGAGFALSLLVILVYWATFTFARDQALTGKFPAALGPWAGNLVILPWALYALWRMRRAAVEGAGWGHRLVAAAARAPVVSIGALRRRLPPLTADGEPSRPTDLGGTSSRFVGRMDAYLGKLYLRVLFFAVLSVYVIYALVKSKNLMDALLRHQQPLSLLLSYLKYFAPGVLPVVLPISCLVGAVVGISLASRTGELTALKANGVSMRRATIPVLILTLVACVLIFVVEDRIAPAANRKAQAIEDQINRRAPRTYGPPAAGRWSFGPEGRHLYHYRFYDAVRQEFQGLSVFGIDRSRPRITDHRFAERARWLGDVWDLEGGWYRTFPEMATDFSYEINDGVVRLELDPPGNFASTERSLSSTGELPEQLSMAELAEEIRVLEGSGYDLTRLRVAYHGKLARALTPLVMVLLGLPFAFRIGRRGSLYAVGVAFLLVLVYWATFAIFNALGLETILDPWVAAWAPNVLFALLGAYLMLYVRT